MKVLVIGGNRFVGLRLTHWLSQQAGVELSIVNRTGQAPHASGAAVYKADRRNWLHSSLDRDWDQIVDFAGFNESDAQGSLDYFKNVGRYTFISTLSIYDPGSDLKESDFNPLDFDLKAPLESENGYQEGKRRAEAVFAQRAKFPVTQIRFPLILGPDDYTRRLDFHIERVENGRPLHFPNLGARLSMIHSQDASSFLQWNLAQTFTGPLNVAAPRPISLKDLMARIEKSCGRKALLIDKANAETSSPYGVTEDMVQNCELAKKLGFEARPIETWLGELIESGRSSPSPASRLH